MAEFKWLSQELDGATQYIRVAESAVPTYVQSGWFPSGPPPKQPKAPIAPAVSAPVPAAVTASPSPTPKPRKRGTNSSEEN